MNQLEITEAQEWQLFELLEGNLSPQEAAKLQVEIANQPALEHHFNLLKQTYSTAPEIHFPNSHLLKKQPKNKQVYLWTWAAAAAVIAILLLWKPTATITSKSPLQVPNKLGKAVDQPNSSLKPAEVSGLNQTKSRIKEAPGATEPSVVIHPLIMATNDFRGHRNDSQQKIHVIAKIETSNTQAEQQLATGENHNHETSPIPFGFHQNKDNGAEITNTAKAEFTKNPAPRKTGFALAKSFYNDGKTMIQNGHVPHVNIKTKNKLHSLIPTIEMGLRLENNIIMASFNQ